jgi:acetyltransferase-like isoleucine patch superfamily enzyme
MNHANPDELAAALGGLAQQLRERLWAKWKRDLPFDEALFDRWERARRLGFDEGASIYQHSCVYGDVRVGAHTWIGPFTILDGTGGLRIGHHCSISSGVQIYTHDSVNWALTGGKAKYEHSPVMIGDCCYIGSQTVIAKGVTLGDHVVIGACAFVNEDIPSNAIAIGVPARAVGHVEIDGADVRLVYHA